MEKNNYQILIYDDCKELLNLLKELIEDEHNSIHVTSSYRNATNKINELKFDIVLLKIEIANIRNTTRLIENIYNISKKTVVIGLTSIIKKVPEKILDDKKIIKILEKPFTPNKLFRTLEKAKSSLNNYKKKRKLFRLIK